MTAQFDAVLRKEFDEARAAVARHGVVIVRAVEEDLVPAIMAAARDSLSASPRGLSKLGENALDRLVEDLRKAAGNEAHRLRDMYVRVLADIGGQEPKELAKTIDGIEELFEWERIARTSEPVNKTLVDRGFQPLRLAGPADVSDSFEIELTDKWPAAVQRLRSLAVAMADQSAPERVRQEEAKPAKRKGRRGRRGDGGP